MRQILLIISLLISLSSFAQDDFFWSYSHPKESYDTITLKVTAQQNVSLSGIFTTYSGDSLTFIDPFGTHKKLPSGIASSSFPLIISNGETGYLVTKRSDLMLINYTNTFGDLNFYNISSARRLQHFELSFRGNITSNIFTKNKSLESLILQESFVSIPSGILDISNNNLLKEIYIQNTPIQSITLSTSPDLSSIDIPENQLLTSVTFGELSPTIGRFYAYNSHFDQTNIDKILKYFVDSNRNPFELGTYGTDYINLCGSRNGYPSNTGYGYVTELTNRGWFVCVNNNSTTPIVSTNDPTMISSNSVTLGGNASSDGGAAITTRGVAYGTSLNPTTSGDHIASGSGIGVFSVNVTGLLSSTLYHVRAYATNSNGTSYGEDKTFTTTDAIQTIPELITTAPTAITTTTASSGGIITFDGNYEIIEKGVCWSTSPNPNYNSSKTNDGSGTAQFTSSVTGLSPNTTYYLRAYARNRRDAGGSYVYVTGYGQEEVFATASSSECSLPTITTNSVNTITTNSALGGGNVTSDGGCDVTAKGLCWSTSTNPTTANSHTTDGSGIGAFSSSLTGLSAGYDYYVRAYATNSSGTAYGNQVSFTTLCNLPTIAFYACSNPTASSVVVSANISSDGGCVVTSRGFDYCTDGSFTTILGSVTVGSGIGSYNTTITGLQCNTRYYFRPWATNSVGTCYGVNCTDNVGAYCTTSACPTTSFYTRVDMSNCGTYDITDATTLNQACTDVKSGLCGQMLLTIAPYGGYYYWNTFATGSQLYSDSNRTIPISSSFYSLAYYSSNYYKVHVINGIMDSVTLCP